MSAAPLWSAPTLRSLLTIGRPPRFPGCHPLAGVELHARFYKNSGILLQSHPLVGWRFRIKEPSWRNDSSERETPPRKGVAS